MKSGTLTKLALGGLLAASVGGFATNANASLYNLGSSAEHLYVQLAGTTNIVEVPSADWGSFYVGISGGNTYVSTTASLSTDSYNIETAGISNNISTANQASQLVTTSTTVTGLGNSGTNLLPVLNIFGAAAGFTVPSAAPPNAWLTNQISSSSHLSSFLHGSAILSGTSCLLSGSTPSPYTCGAGSPYLLGTTPVSAETFGSSSNTSSVTSQLITSFTAPYDLASTTILDLQTNDLMSTTLTTELQSVPEPLSMSLMAVGLLGLTVVYRRRNRA